MKSLRGHRAFERHCAIITGFVKGAAAHLATDLPAYVTGQVFAVEGGWTEW
jgi:hypothetical protein